MVSPAVSRTLRYLAGIQDDEEPKEPGLLDSLGQGIQGIGQGISQGISDAGTAISSGLSSAAQTVQDAYAVPTEQRPPQYSGPSYAQPSLAPGEQSTLERLPAMGSAAVEGAGEMLGDRGAMLAGLKPPQSAMDVIEQAAPAPVRGLQIGREALRAAGGAALEAAPQTTDPLFTTNEIQTPLGTIPSMTGPTPQQAGRFVGEELADPTNYLNFGAAGRAADAPVGEVLGAVGRRVRGALAGNAERMAAADARMAAEGSTAAPASLGALPEPPYSPAPPEGTTRRYHGTASAFDAADPAQFDENGLYGPGYYTTSDPRVASSYATQQRFAGSDEHVASLTRQREMAASTVEALRRGQSRGRDISDAEIAAAEDALRGVQEEMRRVTGQGPNVRALDLSPEVKLIDADAPLTRETLDRMTPWVERARDVNRDIGDELNDVVDRLHISLDQGRPVTNDAMLTELMDAGQRALGFGPRGEGRGIMTAIMERLGYDGIAHQGGLRVPMTDAAGNPIQHDVSVIFPGSVNKVRNAFSGTYGGATLGTLLPEGAARSDRLAGVNRVLSQGLVSSASGGMSAAAADQLGDPDDPYRQAKAFAAGALVPPLAARGARGLARLAGAAPHPGGGALGTLGALPEDAARQADTLGPVARRVMDTYTALTPKRVEAVTAKGIDVATAAIEKRARPGAMPVPAAELVPQIHAAVVRNLDDTKVVMTGLNYGALRAFLRGEGLTSKAETGNLDLINQITTTQVNVAGGRQVLDEATGTMKKAPFTIKEGADFAQRESEQMRAATGGTRFPDPETGAIDTEAPKVLYAYVSEGQPLVAPNRPTLGLVWKPETPRVSSVNHPFGLLSPNLDMHKAMAEGSQDLVYAADAVRGGRIAPATMEGGRLVEATAGVPSSGKARFGWEQGGIDVGGGRTLVDTDYLVGPEGESSLRATSLVSGMSKDIQEAIARGQMTDPEQIAAVLMRGGSPQWKPGWGSVMNPTRTESLVLDPHLANVQAIYISGTPSNLSAMLEGAKTGGVGGGKGERLAELEMARRMRAAIKAETNNDVPIIFNDTSRAAASKKQLAEGASNEGFAPRLISDAQVLEGPPLTLSPGRGRIVNQYTQAIDPTTGRPYMNIGVSAGAVPPAAGRSDPLASVNRVLGQGVFSGVSGTTGGLVNQEMNPDDPYAFAKGFGTAALLPPLAQRGARGLARLAGARGADVAGGARIALGDVPPSKVRQPGLPGMEPAPPRPIGEELADLPTPGMMPSLPSVQKSLTAAEERAANMAARGITAPSAWDWIKQAGYSGIFGPATLVGNVTAGVVDTGLVQVKEATRALTMRQGGRYGAQAKAQLQAVPEALEGLKAIALGQGGSAGAAARSGGSQGTANLSERVVNPVAHVAARLMEKPGEILAEAPDAVFRPIFNAQGMRREADTIAHELGHRGQQAAQTAEQLLADAQAARANPNQPLVSGEARRIVDAGKAYADEMGYKGDPGGLARWIGGLSKRDDAAGVAASFLFPFSKTPGNIAIAAARSTPGIGLLPGVRQGRPIKSFDVIYDQAFGTLAASGLAAYAASGGITGSGPAAKPERDAMVAQGWQPRSTLVAGHYIPNRAFGKLQPMLDAIGESHDALAYRKPDQSASAFATDAVKRLGAIATDQVGLSGLADVFDLIDGFGAQAPGLVGRSITRYTPFGGVIRAAAQMVDPNARKPETWDQAGFSEATRQQVEQSIPGLRGDVPAAQDVLGRDAPNPQQGWGALIPKTTTVRGDPMIRLFTDAGLPIPPPRDAITVGDISGVELTPAEQRRWNTYRGEVIQKYADKLLANEKFMALSPKQKEETLKDALAEASEAADGKVMASMDRADLKRRATETARKKAS